jgi:filamentous hemagglutinin
LFYADVEQKNQTWINQGLADPAITGLIVRTPIKPQTNPDALDPSRDRLTGLPLDDKGRYTVRVDVGNPIDGYETYTPKYFPCATAECVRSGQNLDMSDPETQAYVKAIDTQVFKDIGTGATVGTLVTPVGTGAKVLFWLGMGAFTAQVASSEQPTNTATDEAIKVLSEKGGEKFFMEVLGHTPSAAARATSLVNLSGGWDAFVGRVKIDLLGVKPDDRKK